MKILQIIDTLLVGGAEDIAVNLAIGFKKRGHQSEIFLLSDRTSKKNISKLRSTGINVNILESPKYSFASILEVRKKIEDFNPDIMQTHLSGFYYFLSNLRTKKNIVHTAHALHKTDSGPKGWLFSKILLRHAAACVAVSEAVDKSIKKAYHLKNTTVIRNGIKITNRRSVGKPALGKITKKLAGKIIFVNVANLKPVKNHELLIKSFFIVHKSFPKTKLIIAGDGPLKKKLTLQINALKLGNDVFLLGSRNDIKEILNISDIFVLSSKVEGLSVSLLEAMERKLPLISTKAGGSMEIILSGKNGYLVDSNEKSMSHAMIKLVKDGNLRKKMGLNGRKIVENRYSTEIMTENYLRLYKKILKNENTTF